jgi:hypothetical protein
LRPLLACALTKHLFEFHVNPQRRRGQFDMPRMGLIDIGLQQMMDKLLFGLSLVREISSCR